MYCPRCGSRMHSKGFYTRKLNHPVLQDSTKFYMIVKQRKWHCDECNLYMNDSFPFWIDMLILQLSLHFLF